MQGKHQKRRIRILVKAFPQPSTKHEETVCCAGVTEDGRELLRLYPIRYRRLPKGDQFDRYDLVEMTTTKAPDPRPESHRVDEGSIRLIQHGGISDEAKVKLWRPFIAPSIGILIEENKTAGRSLGIIRPQPESIRFIVKEAKDSNAEDQEVADLVFHEQASLLEDPLKPIEKPKHSFSYQFTCADPTRCTCAKNPHTHQIHDWEVQATYFNYKRKYKTEEETLAKMRQAYQESIPTRNLHFIMGTMASHPKTFIMWDAALGYGPRGAVEAVGDVLANNQAGTVGSPDGMQLNPGRIVSSQNALQAFASFLMYEIYSKLGFRVNVLMQDPAPG